MKTSSLFWYLVVLVSPCGLIPLSIVDDTTSPFFFSKSDLFESMFGHLVGVLGGNGEKWALKLGAKLVGNEGNGTSLSVREGYRPGALLVGGAVGTRGARLGAQGSVSRLEGEGIRAPLRLAAGLRHNRDVFDAVAELILTPEAALRGSGSHGDEGEEDDRLHDDS